MDGYSDSLTRIGLGFRGAGDLTVIIIAIVLAILASFVIYQAVKNFTLGYRAIRSIREGRTERTAEGSPKRLEKMNAPQIKAVYDLISEFKRREILAEAIPVSVLEHFAEFFYRNIERLNIGKGMAKLFAPSLFPIHDAMAVEIEIVHDNRLYVFEKRVVEKTEKRIAVHKIENLSELTEQARGQKIAISYVSNRLFIRGESRIINPSERGLLVLTYPKDLTISQERRFSRVPVTKEVSAFLTQVQNPDAEKIKARIRDISMEGVRVETSSVLRKNVIYGIAFEDRHFEAPYVFDNFECIVTKSMISDDNLFDYGLAFVYVNVTNRTMLANYINEWVNPLKI